MPLCFVRFVCKEKNISLNFLGIFSPPDKLIRTLLIRFEERKTSPRSFSFARIKQMNARVPLRNKLIRAVIFSIFRPSLETATLIN